MIKVICAKCRKELIKPGALIISSPVTGNSISTTVVKLHLCKKCEKLLDYWLLRSPNEVK